MIKIYDIVASTDITINHNIPECKNLLFKVRENHYWDGKAIHENRTIQLLKRKSCKCPNCEYVLKEVFPNIINDLYDFDGNNLVRDKIYKLVYTLDEDGDCQFRFEPIKEMELK